MGRSGMLRREKIGGFPKGACIQGGLHLRFRSAPDWH